MRKRRIDQLTTAQEDYLEATLRLQSDLAPAIPRISDIAAALGTRLPTVTRTVQRLTHLGLIDHPTRGGVALTRIGRKVALEIAHRHRDLVDFFSLTLGLPAHIAEQDACQIEHGLSPITAQRLHEFMEYFHQLSPRQRSMFESFKRRVSETASEFSNIPNTRAAGWRG
ncbi:MAG: metal-dependent transcriptional regulator [Candidatus Zixiibacteriota bacterium]